MAIKTKPKIKRFFVSLDLANYKILEEVAIQTGYLRASNFARSIIFKHLTELALTKFESSVPLKLKKERGKK